MDIASKLLAWEEKLQEFDSIISKLSAPRVPKKTRGHARQQSSTQAPAYVKELKDLLAGLSGELRDIRRELSHTAAPNIRDAASCAVAVSASSSAKPFRGTAAFKQTERPAESPAKSQAEDPHAPERPHPGTTPLSNAAEASDSTATSPLSEVDSDLEWALQHANSLCQADVETPATTRPKFSLTMEEMGQNFIPNISGMVKKENFAGKIRIENLPEVDWAGLKSMQPKDREHLGIQYSRGPDGPGYCFVKLSTSTRFVIPDPPQETAGLSDDDIIIYLDEVANNPPSTTKTYYAGPSVSPQFGSLLHPGEALASSSPIAGGNSPYDYIGQKNSATCFHRDDANLWSCNLVGSGWKLWLVIPQRHTERFEAFVRRHWEANRCDQFVRHLSLFVGPTRLRQEGIDFIVHCAGPGDMIIIKPGQYHAVVNYSTCFATSINFTLPGEPVMPSNLAVCKQCGLYPLELSDFRMVSPPVADNVSEPEPSTKTTERTKLARRPAARQTMQPIKKIKTVQVQSDLDLIVQQVLKIDKLCNIPHINEEQRPSPGVLKLALAISSRAAVQQFCDLVRSRRDPNNGRARLHLSKDLHTRIGQRLGALGVSQRKSDLEKFLVRLDQYYLACDIEESKQGRINADAALIDKIATKAQCSKKTLAWHQYLGKRWMRLCGARKELLCFIFLGKKNPFSIGPDVYLDLDEKDMNSLRLILDNEYIASLCAAAAAFLGSLDGMSDDCEYGWETHTNSMSTLPEEKMLMLLQPILPADENVYNPEKYPDWPRPPGWPDDYPWPADPTMILSANDRSCDFCDDQGCDCIHNIPSRGRLMPRIKDYGGLGRGLQAVANEDGRAAYQAGETIGFLTGEIVPVGTFDDSWTLDFARPDLDEEPLVCQIRCAERSNNFRLLNHACKPSARFIQMRASGRYVTAIKAVHDLPDGAQITVSYGKDWKINGCHCHGCRPSTVHEPFY